MDPRVASEPESSSSRRPWERATTAGEEAVVRASGETPAAERAQPDESRGRHGCGGGEAGGKAGVGADGGAADAGRDSIIDQPLRIGVCGGGVAGPEDSALAEEVGRRIGDAGAVLVCGGRTGVMEAAARGAVQAGGLTVGILPGEHAEEANPCIRLPLPTGMGEARNVLVVRASDAVIAIGGEWGTLSEIALAGKIGVPVVLLRPTLARALALEHAHTAEEAVSRALAHARQRRA